ncbi:uncharacterized protein LOC113282691 isoform X2 [Papaver somniferum]|uniref:uncharacterized protein LOC113282691 isoform X2 n=1 Tax=Papaver somniferum TaxID=3469 RepID=UPI000E6FED31|nr:uncharacterized protein LOC113282691 isoform X2 [Papaver somniferum]
MMMMMVEEDGGGDWVKEAMKDEFIVAELLTRLKMKKQDDSGSSPLSSSGMKMMTSLEWGIRQPRSRQVMIRCRGGSNNTNNQNQNQTSTATTVQIKKEGGGGGESTRASPTTPLSWSTGGCGSGGGGGGDGVSICGGDGYEDSSKLIRQRPTSAASLRSIKVNGTSEPNNRRARKKKTFAELKEEESLMLKERFHLKKELATLRRSWEEEKARNNQLKRIKVDLQHISSNQRVTTVISQEVIYSQSCNNGGIDQTLMLPMVLIGARHDVGMSVVPPATLTLSNEPKENEARQSLFDLPDLNEPFGEDSGPEVLYGMS